MSVLEKIASIFVQNKDLKDLISKEFKGKRVIVLIHDSSSCSRSFNLDTLSQEIEELKSHIKDDVKIILVDDEYQGMPLCVNVMGTFDKLSLMIDSCHKNQEIYLISSDIFYKGEKQPKDLVKRFAKKKGFHFIKRVEEGNNSYGFNRHEIDKKPESLNRLFNKYNLLK